MIRGQLLETVGGIPIYAKADPNADPLALLPGRRGRLVLGGPVYEVDRLTDGAAYVHKVYDPPLERPIGPWDEMKDAADFLLRAINRSLVDAAGIDQAYTLAKQVGHLAGECRKIIVYKGGSEPGISRSARFVERVLGERVL